MTKQKRKPVNNRVRGPGTNVRVTSKGITAGRYGLAFTLPEARVLIDRALGRIPTKAEIKKLTAARDAARDLSDKAQVALNQATVAPRAYSHTDHPVYIRADRNDRLIEVGCNFASLREVQLLDKLVARQGY